MTITIKYNVCVWSGAAVQLVGWAKSKFKHVTSAWLGKRQPRTALTSELERAEVFHRQILDAIDLLPQGIVIIDENYRYVAWNKAYTTMYPTTADLIIADAPLEDAIRAGVARGDYPEAAGREQEWIEDRLKKLKTPSPRHEQRLADGRWTMIEDCHMPNGSIVSLRVDITEMKRREESIRQLFDANPVPMFICDPVTWAIQDANTAAVSHYGYSRDQLERMTFADIHCAVDGSAREQLLTFAAPTFEGKSYRHVCRDGRLIEVEVKASELNYKGAAAILTACIDTTERRLNALRLLHMSRHDPLTNLPNRTLLNEKVQEALKIGEQCSLMFLDLDKFKGVNDMLGHAAGDLLLVQVAKRLQSCVRVDDIVVRLGGDEFAILLPQVQPGDIVAKLAERIIKSLNEPFLIGGRQASIGVSIGIASAPGDATAGVDLVRLADIAMYAAKGNGRNTFCFFEADMSRSAIERVEFEADLKRALQRDEFELHYQPIIDLATGEVLCREALVRWRHPEKGLISPIKFVPFAEKTGLIHELSDIVMRKACQEAANWPDSIKVSVNVSAVELDDEVVVQRIRRSLDEAGLSPGRLQVELTETALMNSFDVATRILRMIRDLGVEIVMDDFGTGYSSLSFLRMAPIDKLKIDRAFVRDLESTAGRTLLSTILEMAQALGIRSTAEGIETEEQSEVLKALGCCEGQGYFYGRPSPLQSRQALAA